MKRAASLILVLTLTVTFSVFNVSNATVNQFDKWVPWAPGPDTVEIQYWQLGSRSYVNVSFYTMSACYNVSSWGVPTLSLRNIVVNAEAWHWTGMCILIVGPFFYRHTYDLGTLPSGDYTFRFRVSNLTVKEITFSVAATGPLLEVEPFYCYVRDGSVTLDIAVRMVEASDRLVGIGFQPTERQSVLTLIYGRYGRVEVGSREGPFLQDPRWNLHGTLFDISPSLIPEFPGIGVTDFLLPDPDGVYAVFPDGGGVVAVLEFHAASNETNEGHIWTWVSLYGSAAIMDTEMGTVEIPSIGGWVCLLEEAVADVVMNGRVDMLDLATVAKRFGSSLGDDLWSVRADVNGDNRIDLRDLGFVANQWGNNFEVPQSPLPLPSLSPPMTL